MGCCKKRQATPEQEAQFKLEMEQLFAEHGNQGVLLHDLQKELEEAGLLDQMPRGRLNRLLKSSDLDENNFVTYNEFMNMYENSETLTPEERTAMKRFVGVAVTNIVPRYMQRDFLRNYTCKPPPFFIFIISLVEIAFFVYYAVDLKKKGIATTAMEGVPVHSPLMYNPTKRHEAWRFISYMFLHQGYAHLISNLLFQLLLGLPLEIVHKWWRVGLVYLAGVVGGSLAHSVTDFNVSLVGASGGCYALIGAHLASVIINFKEMNFKCKDCENPIRVFASAYLRLLILFILVFADTGFAVYRRFYDPAAEKVGITAHIGGMVSGLLLGIPVMKNINELQWERKVAWATIAIYLAVVVFCVIFNGFYKGYPEPDFS